MEYSSQTWSLEEHLDVLEVSTTRWCNAKIIKLDQTKRTLCIEYTGLKNPVKEVLTSDSPRI
jgi:hypothetical protein